MEGKLKIALIFACLAVCLVEETISEELKEKADETVDETKLTYAKGSLCRYCDYCKVCFLYYRSALNLLKAVELMCR